MDVVALPDLGGEVDLRQMDEEAMAYRGEEEEAMVHRPVDSEAQDHGVAEAHRLKDIKGGRIGDHLPVPLMDLALVLAPMVRLRRDTETMNSQKLSIRHTIREGHRSQELSLLPRSLASMTVCPVLR